VNLGVSDLTRQLVRHSSNTELILVLMTLTLPKAANKQSRRLIFYERIDVDGGAKKLIKLSRLFSEQAHSCIQHCTLRCCLLYCMHRVPIGRDCAYAARESTATDRQKITASSCCSAQTFQCSLCSRFSSGFKALHSTPPR